MTLQEAYTKLVLDLKNIYADREAANIADWVIENVTGKKKVDRILSKHIELDGDRERRIAECSTQLQQHKPVQYVLNEAWFAGMKLYVDEAVLIPRPETEELIEWIEEEFKIQNSKLKILDVGTGSGCISLALKSKLKFAEISAIDVSDNALDVAKKNAALQNVDIEFIKADFLNEENWNALATFDIIVSNPPYIKQSEELSMQKNVLEHEPHLALFVPDDDALIFYKRIACFAQKHLNESGAVYVEINEELGAEVEDVFKNYGFNSIEKRKDLQGKDRMVKASLY